MNKTSLIRLTLRRTTVKELASDDLAHAGGGRIRSNLTNGDNETCVSVHNPNMCGGSTNVGSANAC